MLASWMLLKEIQHCLMKPTGLLEVRDVPCVGYDDQRAMRYLINGLPCKFNHMPQVPFTSSLA